MYCPEVKHYLCKNLTLQPQAHGTYNGVCLCVCLSALCVCACVRVCVCVCVCVCDGEWVCLNCIFKRILFRSETLYLCKHLTWQLPSVPWAYHAHSTPMGVPWDALFRSETLYLCKHLTWQPHAHGTPMGPIMRSASLGSCQASHGCTTLMVHPWDL